MKHTSVVGWLLTAWTALGCAPAIKLREFVAATTNSAVQGAASSPANQGTDTVTAQYVAERTASAGGERPKNPLDGARAYRYLQQICAIGPRISGSPGMQQQQEMLRAHFEQLGGKVTLQKFQAANPLGGANVPLANMIVEWHPERKERILLCAHYDTRPLPDQDPNPVQRRTGVFIGANDGASGVAVLMELGSPHAGVRRHHRRRFFAGRR